MWRVYFIMGDLLACILTGAATAWMTQAVIPADWFMVLGMLAGMVLGALAGTIGGFVFAPLFGGMEVMLPVALSAMVAGMGAGMAQTMPGAMDRSIDGISWSEGMLGGALAGLACLAFTYLLQARVRGEVNIREVK